jgi:acetylornithine deacetylase/succinyl-diaminopimelate desuccinylase-like protein
MNAVIPSNAAEIMRGLLANPRVSRALSFFAESAELLTAEQLRLCGIPAPPFGEAARAVYLRDKFAAAGLENARLDGEGNCVALRPGRAGGPALVVSAHLDTVFPPETDFTVRHERGKLYGPGVADDGAGLIALLALAWALRDAEIETAGPLLFVGTVGEEGEGDLRGVRHLFTKGEWAGRVDAFISLDGPGVEPIVNTALGSRRYRVTWRGAGGHSWGDFGQANPVHALGRAIAQLSAYPAPQNPRTTFNVGRVTGGAGVNVIPAEASCEVDLRSLSGEELRRLDAFFRRAVRAATDDENAARRPAAPPLSVELKLIGERPGGATPEDAAIVRLAQAATRAVGVEPHLAAASTDANIPISLGLPAITLGAGGAGGGMHTLHEWHDPRGREIGLQRALLVALAVAGLA